MTNVGVCDGGTLPETSNGTHTQRSKGTKLRWHQATYRTSYGTNLAADYVHWIVYSWHSSRNLQQNTEPNRGGSRLKTLGTKCQSTTPRLITQAPRWQIQYNTEEHRTVVLFGTGQGQRRALYDINPGVR